MFVKGGTEVVGAGTLHNKDIFNPELFSVMPVLSRKLYLVVKMDKAAKLVL